MPEREYFYLCLNCGGISPYSEWEHLMRGDEGELRPAVEGDEDPLERCPNCHWLHADDDSGPGVMDGTLAEMQADWMRVSAEYWDLWTENAGAPTCVGVGSRASLVLGMLGQPMRAETLLAMVDSSLRLLETLDCSERTLAAARRSLKELSANGLPLLVADLERLERAGHATRDGDLWKQAW